MCQNDLFCDQSIIVLIVLALILIWFFNGQNSWGWNSGCNSCGCNNCGCNNCIG